MNTDILTGFLNLGAVGLLLWWMTSFLVPKLMKQLSDSMELFQNEMREERSMHREINAKLLEKHDKAIDGLLSHLASGH